MPDSNVLKTQHSTCHLTHGRTTVLGETERHNTICYCPHLELSLSPHTHPHTHTHTHTHPHKHTQRDTHTPTHTHTHTQTYTPTHQTLTHLSPLSWTQHAEAYGSV